jgi:hypothetical protein
MPFTGPKFFRNYQSQEDFDAAQKKLGVEPVPSPNKGSSHPKTSPGSSHAKTKRGFKPGSPEWQKAWLDTDDEVRKSRRDAEDQDKNKKTPKLYQRFPNKAPKAT